MKALKNFLITLRALPTVTMLNVVGLAVAISVAYIILVQVNYEMSFNRGIKDADRTSLIVADGTFFNNRSYMANMSRAGVELVRNISIVESVGSINLSGRYRGSCTEDDPDGFVLKMSNILYPAETLRMFGFEFVEGDTASLNIYGNFAVSESAARRYNLKIGSRFAHNFSEDIPEYNNSYYYGVVTAIYRDFPINCDLGTMDAVGFYDSNDLTDWGNYNYNVYVQLREGYTFAEFDSLLTKVYSDEQQRFKRENKVNAFFTIPVSELYYNLPDGIDVGAPSSKGDISITLSLATIAVVLLLVAFINFFNFMMSLMPMRVRGVNTRRIMGASIASLRIDFIAESMLFLSLAVLLALFVVGVAGRGSLSTLFVASVDVAQNLWLFFAIVSLIIVLTMVVSLYSGCYLTSFSPAFALNGNFGRNRKGVVLRTLLIGVQFFVSFVFIITALFVWLQNRYLMSADMGFSREYLLTVEMPRSQFYLQGQTPLDELTDLLTVGGYVKDVAFSNGDFIANKRWTVGRTIEGPLPENVERDIMFSPFQVSWNFLKVMGVEVVDGRDFTIEDAQGAAGALIFTDAAKRQFHLSTDNEIAPRGANVPIVGFCNNVNARSLHEQQQPFAFYCMANEEMSDWGKKYYSMRNLYIRLVAGVDVEMAVAHIRKTIVEYFPGIAPKSFDVEFFDDVLCRQYEKEQRLSLMVGIFAFVVIIVSLMGLFATVLFEVKYMEREIALRRVNGAMVADILSMINIKYVKILLVGYLFALPLSCMLVNSWLQSFAYKIELYSWVFIVSLFAVLLVALSIVTITSWRVANSNPIEVLGKGE